MVNWRDTCAACRCGADKDSLHVHTWHMGAGANVWCDICLAGTPSGRMEDLEALVVNLRDGDDARPAAMKAWNTWANRWTHAAVS